MTNHHECTPPILQMLQSIDHRLGRINDRIDSVEQKVNSIAEKDSATAVRIGNLEANEVATKTDVVEVKRILKLLTILVILVVTGHTEAAASIGRMIFGAG